MTGSSIEQYTVSFEKLKHISPEGREFWSARDLMEALGYPRWREFKEALERAAIACTNIGQDAAQHFLGSTRKSQGRPAEDMELSRYAVYLTAMNSDPRKPGVAAAQTYFAVQTRTAEIMQAQMPRTPLQIMRAALEALEQQDTRLSAIEHRLDASPITSEKVGTIYRLGQQLGQVMGNYRAAWGLFKQRFGLASYRDLPTHRYEEAVQFLRMQIAAYTGTPLLDVTP